MDREIECTKTRCNLAVIPPTISIHSQTPLDLPLQQPFEEIKTITITLQRPRLPRRPILPPQLLRHQKAPIPRDALDPRPLPTFCLQRHDLIRMQPILIVGLLELSIEARAAKPCVDRGERGEDAGEQFLEREEWRMRSGQEGD